MTIAARYQIQDGRHSAAGEYGGVTFEVATGYSVEHDHYPIHVYLGAGAVRKRVALVGAHAFSAEAALAAGLEVVKAEIDARQSC